MNPITMHKPFMRFTVHLPDRDIFFKKKRKMHIADFSYMKEANVATTQA